MTKQLMTQFQTTGRQALQVSLEALSHGMDSNAFVVWKPWWILAGHIAII